MSIEQSMGSHVGGAAAGAVAPAAGAVPLQVACLLRLAALEERPVRQLGLVAAAMLATTVSAWSVS